MPTTPRDRRAPEAVPIAATYERNLRLIAVYVAGLNALAWIPVFFLYLASRVSLDRVFLLEAIYYLTVVMAEVPSGYLSDAVGRCAVLRLSSAALTVAYVLFWVAPGFTVLAAAQALMAMGFAFNSGTDAALHYDSLEAIDRTDEYVIREARLVRVALIATAVASLAGGLAAAFSLGFAYLISALLAGVAFAAALGLAEPPRRRPGIRRGFTRTAWTCVGSLKSPPLAWLFGFGVLMTVLNHVPYELIQPYIEGAVVGTHHSGETVIGSVTLWTGAHATTATLLGAWLAPRGVALQKRWGTHGALVATTALQVALIGMMAFTSRLAFVPVLLLRVAPRALMTGPYRGAVLARLSADRRATWLSMESLVGRLGFALFLGVAGLLAAVAPEARPVGGPARVALGIGIVGAAALVMRRRVPDRARTSSTNRGSRRRRE